MHDRAADAAVAALQSGEGTSLELLLPAVLPGLAASLPAAWQSCNVAGGECGGGKQLALLVICTKVKTCNAGRARAGQCPCLAHLLLPGYTALQVVRTSTCTISSAFLPSTGRNIHWFNSKISQDPSVQNKFSRLDNLGYK